MASIRKMNCVWGLIFLGVVLVGVGEAQAPTAAFVQTTGTQFVLNGSTFLFNGFNSYWMMTVAADPTQRYKVSDVFAQASAAGLRVCRTWAFCDGGDQVPLQKSPGVYDENTFQALDFVVSEAGKYNIKLIMTLVNNWPNFGGKPRYVEWARSAGVPVSSDDDFFTNAVIKGYYKNNVKTVLTRVNTITKIAYKEDLAIMAWELMNEPRCQVNDSGKTLTVHACMDAEFGRDGLRRWHPSLNPLKKLLAVGLEGFYGDQSPHRKQYNPGTYIKGTDFIGNNLVKEIDFTTIYAYPETWLEGDSNKTQMEFLDTWLRIHWSDSRRILRKPLIFEEFGKLVKYAGQTVEARDSYLNAVYSKIYNLARRGRAVAGGLVWQIMSEGMDSYCDGFQILLPQSPSTTIVLRDQATRMTALERPL